MKKCSDKRLKNNGILRSFSVLALASSALMLSGCAHTTAPASNGLPIAPPVIKANPAQQREAAIAALRDNGVQVFHLGQTVRIVMPSDSLFHYLTPNIRFNQCYVLNQVARLLNTFHIVSVKVAAYSDNAGSSTQQTRLTTEQAEAVQRYLSNKGIRARLIYGVGLGSRNAIASNHFPGGRASNRRVEISFKYYTLNAYD